MEPTRCHFTVVFENVVKVFWQLLPSIVIPLLAAQSLGNTGLILFLGILAIGVIALGYQILAWRQTWLSAEPEQLMIRSGLFWKKSKAIPYEKINTIDLSRNLFQRVFGTCRIKIDTGAVTGGDKKGSEVNLVFTIAQAEAIRATILALAAGSGVPSLRDGFAEQHPGQADVRPTVAAPDGNPYTRPEYQTAASDGNGAESLPATRTTVRARTSDFFLYGLTESKFLAIFGLIFGFMAFAGELIDEQAIEWIGNKLQIVWGQVSQWEIIIVILLSAAVFAAIYLVANIVSILFAIVRFYNFSASREGDNIHIEYGLLTAKSYTLPIKNIHAVIIGQNLFRQLLHQCSVEVVSIGYGDEKNEVALLIPMIRLDRLEEILGSILPEYKGELPLQPAPIAAIRRYFLVPALALLTGVAIAACFWTSALFSLIILLPWLGVSRWLNYRNAGISYSADRLEARSGGFTRKRYRVRMDAIQSVSASSHPFLERSGLRNYRIDYHAPALRAIIRVKFLAQSHLNDLRLLLDHCDSL